MTVTVGSLTSSDPELAAIAVTTAVANTFPVYTSVGPPVVVTNKSISTDAQAFLALAGTARLANLGGAPLASPSFTGLPKAPNPTTAAVGEAIATTPWVTTQITAATSNLFLPLAGGTLNGSLIVKNGYFRIDRTAEGAGAVLQLITDIGQPAQISWYVGPDSATAKVRWVLQRDNDPESGLDVGSNFEIRNYSDSGAYLSTALWIERKTGRTTFTNAPIITTPATATGNYAATTQQIDDATAPLATIASPVFTGTSSFGGVTYFHDSILLDRKGDGASALLYMQSTMPTTTQGYASYIYFQSDAIHRWIVGKNTGAETGVNNATGGDFIIWAYDDDGAIRPGAGAVTINRDTKVMALGASPTAPTPALTDSSTKLATTAWVKNNSGSIVTLRSLGVPVDGTSDCTDEFQAAALLITSGMIVDGEGLTYKFTKSPVEQIVFSTVAHNVTMQNMTLDFTDPVNWSRPTTTPCILVKGSLGGAQGLAASMVQGQTGVTLTTAMPVGITKNAYVFFIDTTVSWSPVHGACPSEIHQVASTNFAGLAFNIYGGAYYPIGSAAVVSTITFLAGWTFRNIRMYGPTNGSDGDSFGLRLEYMRDVLVDHCLFDGFDYSNLQLHRCLRGKVTNSYFAHAAGALAFGVHLTSGSQDITISNNSFADIDQAVDLGNHSGSGGGVNRQIVITGNIFSDMRSEAISTHGSSDFVVIADNVITCSRNAVYIGDPTTRSSGAAIIRGINTSFKNNKCWNAGETVLSYSNTVALSQGYFECTGNEFMKCYGGGIFVSSDTGALRNTSLDISHNLIEGVYGDGFEGPGGSPIPAGLRVIPNVAVYERIRIEDNTVMGYWEGIRVYCEAGLNTELISVSGNTVFGINLSPYGAGSRGIYINIAGASSDYIRCVNNLVTLCASPIGIFHSGAGLAIKYLDCSHNGVEPYSGGTGRAIYISSSDVGMTRVKVNDNMLMASQTYGIYVRGSGTSGRCMAVGNMMAGASDAVNLDSVTAYTINVNNFV